MVCPDERVCCYRNKKKGTCTILFTLYRKSGRCPYCKENPDDIGMRETMDMNRLASIEREAREKILQWKIRTGRIDPYDIRKSD